MKGRRNHWILSGVAAGLLLSGSASAATINVNTTDDELNVDGDCSLREAVRAAETDTAVDACAAGLVRVWGSAEPPTVTAVKQKRSVSVGEIEPNVRATSTCPH